MGAMIRHAHLVTPAAAGAIARAAFPTAFPTAARTDVLSAAWPLDGAER